ncbi:D-alanine--D-alanine ligase family protein [Desulfurispira natronophila]|uniref:D-alanine--D-alanine ligase n=1 Tax=Desulfurispira natronophila TaxID=682562 RepID=A0A7W8DH88_9BACT|nr:D-alanine--D-alanine ligase [Desulfurispira natronophila]MBB5022142.1 D-alanine-D-alanine ligase [Desulfurispira natronophila]
MSLHVGLLMGGTSREREVSLQSGQGIGAALQSLGHQVTKIDPAVSGDLAKASSVDVVYNTLHGGTGENGVIQGYLEMLGIPSTGTGVTGSAVAMDKVITKKVAVASGIPTPHFAVYSEEQRANLLQTIGASSLTFPLVVKSPCEGSSIGVHLVNNEAELQAALDDCFDLDLCVLIEEYIEGYEVTCGFIGTEVLPLVGIVAGKTFYDYEAKYSRSDTTYHLPARLDESVAAQLVRYSSTLSRTLRLRGTYRVDFLVRHNIPYLLEINTNPGMTPTSLIPKAAQLRDWDFATVVERVLQDTLG